MKDQEGEQFTRPAHWRLGKHYGIHVYEGERPVATFHDPADAMLAIAAHNLVVDGLVLSGPEDDA